MAPKKNKIAYGEIDHFTAEDFEPQNVKERISIMIDQDILIELRRQARESGGKYQSMINQILRSVVMAKKKKSLLEMSEEEVKTMIQKEVQAALKGRQELKQDKASRKKGA